MIPKIIHYCWFGRKPLPKSVRKCLASWEKHLPDYAIKEWNEENFDINSNAYVKEAYQAGRFAFVADYVRIYALYREGGIYMDTDVQVIKNLDNFLDYPAFLGFEAETCLSTGVIGGERHGKWAEWQLQCYEGRHFVKPDGSLDLTTNVQTISEAMKADGFILQNGIRTHKGIVHVFPQDYFSPKSYKTGKIELTANSHTIHHFSGSWKTPKEKWIDIVAAGIGARNTRILGKIRRFIFRGKF